MGMTREEAIRELKIFNGTTRIRLSANFWEALNMAIKALEPCEDEYIKVPKKALKYRTAGMVAYNAEWLKNHFDIERAVICGDQQPCEEAISRQAVLDGLASIAKAKAKSDAQKALMGRVMLFTEQLPPVTPQPKTGHWIEDENEMKVWCSECGEENDNCSKHCPNCGAKMIEPQESEE